MKKMGKVYRKAGFACFCATKFVVSYTNCICFSAKYKMCDIVKLKKEYWQRDGIVYTYENCCKADRGKHYEKNCNL